MCACVCVLEVISVFFSFLEDTEKEELHSIALLKR